MKNMPSLTCCNLQPCLMNMFVVASFGQVPKHIGRGRMTKEEEMWCDYLHMYDDKFFKR
jgi:hypothetical protein